MKHRKTETRNLVYSKKLVTCGKVFLNSYRALAIISREQAISLNYLF